MRAAILQDPGPVEPKDLQVGPLVPGALAQLDRGGAVFQIARAS